MRLKAASLDEKTAFLAVFFVVILAAIGDALGMHWGCIGNALGVHWERFEEVLRTYWGCIGEALRTH